MHVESKMTTLLVTCLTRNNPPNKKTLTKRQAPLKSATGPRLVLDSTALHCSAGCRPRPAPKRNYVLEVGEYECGAKTCLG